MSPGLRPLALRGDADDFPGQAAALQRADEPGAGIDLPAAQSMAGGSGEGVVVVVPRLAEGERCEPGEVAGVVAGGERSPAEEVAQRVDAEGHVVEQEDAHGSAPQEAGEPADERAGQREAESRTGGQAHHHPERERTADEAQVAIGEQVLGVAAGVWLVLAADHPAHVRVAESAQRAAPSGRIVRVWAVRVAGLVGEAGGAFGGWRPTRSAGPRPPSSRARPAAPAPCGWSGSCDG